MTDTLSHFLIFSRGPGAILQHSGEFKSARDAFADFADTIGGADRAAYRVIPATERECREVEDWDNAGAPAEEAPLWLDNKLANSLLAHRLERFQRHAPKG